MKPLLKVIWITFQSLTKLHWILFISKNNSRFLVTSEVQCGLQSVKHCPSMLAEKTNHGAFADTISCPSEDGPLSNKFQIWPRNVTTFRKHLLSRGKELDTVLLYRRWLRAPQSCKRKYWRTTVKTFNRELPLFLCSLRPQFGKHLCSWGSACQVTRMVLEGPSPLANKTEGRIRLIS